jgi:hypothetical protein
MATIPNIAQQPNQQFQPSMNAEVTPNGVHFKTQKDPLSIKTLIVPDELMVQVIALWLQAHPQEAVGIMQALKKKQSAELDIIRTVQSSKNG